MLFRAGPSLGDLYIYCMCLNHQYVVWVHTAGKIVRRAFRVCVAVNAEKGGVNVYIYIYIYIVCAPLHIFILISNCICEGLNCPNRCVYEQSKDHSFAA